MKEKNEIDQVFRDALYSREIPYDPKSWAEAEKLLTDHRKKRYFLYRFRFYLSALFLSVISGSAIYLMTSETNISRESAPSSPSVSGQQSFEMAKVPSKQPAITSLIKVNDVVEANPALEMTSPEKNENRTIPVPEVSVQTNSPDRKSIAKSGFTPQFSGGKTSPETAVSDVTENTTGQGEGNISDYMDNSIAVNEIMATDREFSSEPPVTIRTETVVAQNEEKNSGLLAMKGFDPLISTGDLPEPELIVTPQPDPDKLRPRQTKLSGFKIIAGAGVTPKVRNEGSLSRSNYNYFVGLGYEKLVFSDFAIELRTIFSRRNAFGVNYVQEETQFGFGFSSVSSEYEYIHLNYLDVPLILHYNFRPLHQVGFGIQYSYLMSAEYLLIEREKNSFTSDLSYETSGRHGNSVFNRSDLGLVLSYQYGFNERIKAGINVHYGLLNVVNEKYLPETSYSNNQLRLLLSYRIFK